MAAVHPGYAQLADGSFVAYTAVGSGPFDVLEMSNGTLFSFAAADEQEIWRRYEDRLASFSRLLRFDPRGVGLSDPLVGFDVPGAQRWADDGLAVLDAAGSESAALVGTAFAGAGAVLLAATQPERVRALVLVNAFAHMTRSDDYPIGVPAAVLERFRDSTMPSDGEPETSDMPMMVPSMADNASFAAWWRAAGQRGASPASARAMISSSIAVDVRALLSEVRVPTLVLHARDNGFVRADHGRYLAEHIPGAVYRELPVGDHVPWASPGDFAGEIEEFLTGTRQADFSNRVLATVVFTDIADSTSQAVAAGDQAWRAVLDQHDRLVERQIVRFGGRLVKTTGDGILATFDSPARAVQAAQAMRDAAQQIGVTVRAGMHTGEIERRGDDVAGIAVHTAARVCALAAGGEILVSSTVRDLVAGSGLAFRDRGEHELKGLPGTWRVFATDEPA